MTYWKTLTSAILLAPLLSACSGGGNPVDGLGEAFSRAPSPPVSIPGSVIITDIVFKQAATEDEDFPLELDIYQPEGSCDQNRPTILYVHHGSFIGLGGTRDWQPIPELAEAANGRNMNFVVMDYRALAHKPVLEANYQAIADEFLAMNTFLNVFESLPIVAASDVVSAAEWMQTNANTYCIDMSRFALWGDEAGAIAALQAAYGFNQYGITMPEPDVVVSYSGALQRPSDLEFREAPLLMFSGKESETVPYPFVEDMAAAADAASVPYSFYTLDSHGTFLPRDPFDVDINGTSLLTITLDFIEAHLFGGMPIYETVRDPN